MAELNPKDLEDVPFDSQDDEIKRILKTELGHNQSVAEASRRILLEEELDADDVKKFAQTLRISSDKAIRLLYFLRGTRL